MEGARGCGQNSPKLRMLSAPAVAGHYQTPCYSRIDLPHGSRVSGLFAVGCRYEKANEEGGRCDAD